MSSIYRRGTLLAQANEAPMSDTMKRRWQQLHEGFRGKPLLALSAVIGLVIAIVTIPTGLLAAAGIIFGLLH